MARRRHQPGRVGRLAEVSGPVWWFDLEQGQWAEAQRNRPLTAGDRVSTGRDARAELRIGSTTVKLAEGTELELLRLDDERVRIQLHRGSIALRLRSREVALETAFGTDEAWLQPQRGGLYRLDREDDTTFANAWRGEMRSRHHHAPISITQIGLPSAPVRWVTELSVISTRSSRRISAAVSAKSSSSGLASMISESVPRALSSSSRGPFCRP